MKAAEALRYCRVPARMTSGNAVRLLVDGREAFPAMLAAIAQARRTVHLETYILRADRTGRRFAEALAAAARRGARVRLIYDAVGSLGLPDDFLRDLAAAGVSVHAYRPVRLLALPSFLREGHRRNHRKILVADGRIGFTGGLNIGEEYAPPEEGGGGWRDNHAQVEGPAAAALDAAFLRLWRAETGEDVAPPRRPSEGPRMGAWVGVLANQNLIFRHRIRIAILHALRRARRTIDIAHAYFIPDGGIRRALRKAVARGVAVRVLVPECSDVPLAAYAGRRLHDALLRDGVRLYAFTGGVFHGKTIVVDRLWCAVGSYNVDHRSLFHNLELNLHVVDQRFGRDLSEAFEADLAAAREILLADWRRRPRRERWKEKIAYALRYWL